MTVVTAATIVLVSDSFIVTSLGLLYSTDSKAMKALPAWPELGAVNV